MRFREKTYIITLVLFLLFFNVGIFSLAYYTYENSMAAAEELCLEESRVIAQGFIKDSKYINYAATESILMRSYCSRYAENGIALCFIDPQTGAKESGDLPEGITIPADGYHFSQRIHDVRYFIASQIITEENILLVYAKDVSYLDRDFLQLSTVYVATSTVASALLALCLFFVLRRLSRPLERLRAATEEIANGNFQCRADDSGRDEFSLLAVDFNRMAEHIGIQMAELKGSADAKQRMLDNLAHEMHTPLTSIRGYAEYLLNANIDEKEKADSLEFIISEAERLKSIGRKMLDEAFIRENKIIPERLDLGELVLDAADKMRIKAANRRAELKTEAEEIYLNCDRLLIELLITNLADNALKACRENGKVVMGCKKEKEKILLWVSDNGVGMTEEQIKRITEPFYRTDKSRSREEGGTGLGLSLCEKIANAHGAILSFESEIDKGTTATVTFTNS